MRRPYPSVWSFLGFSIKWWLLFVAMAAACIVLVQAAYPRTAVLAIIAFVLLYLYDYARLLNRMRPASWRVEDPWPRKLWKAFVITVTVAVVLSIFGEIIAATIVIALTILGIILMLMPLAAHFGWGPYGRLERHLNRPPLVEPRFQASRNPSKTPPS